MIQLFTSAPVFFQEGSACLSDPALGREPHPITCLHPLFRFLFPPPGCTGFLPPAHCCISQSCLHADLPSQHPWGGIPTSSSLFMPSGTFLSSPAAALLPAITHELSFPSLGTNADSPLPPQAAASCPFPAPRLGLGCFLLPYVIPHTRYLKNSSHA